MYRPNLLKPIFILCALLLLSGCDNGGHSAPSAYVQTIAKGRALMKETVAVPGVVSASLALVADGRIVWSETFGVIDKATQTPPGPNTMFAIGSTSKMIAGLAVMKLVDQGKIDLDTPLVHYLPDFNMLSPEYIQVTPRMLLSHAAGFPGGDYRNDVTYAPQTGFAEQVQETLATQRMKFTPGEMATYCNDCFTMIDRLVAAVSDQHSYTRFVQDEIFTPLGMTHTRFAESPFPPGSYAQYYLPESATPDPQIYTNAYPAGGIYSTPNDMARVATLLMNGGWFGGVSILSEQAVAEMGRDQTQDLVFNPVTGDSFGLGWDYVAYPGLASVGVRAWSKPGGTAGYVTQIIVAPDERLAVIVTGAGMTFNAYKPAESILLNALAEQGSIPAVPEPLPSKPLPERPATDAELAAITGDYADFKGLYRVWANDHALAIDTYMGGVWFPTARNLKLRTDGKFSSDDNPNMAYWVVNGLGRRYLARHYPGILGHYLNEEVVGQSIEPAAPLSAAWRQRAGQHWLIVNEVASSLHLVRDNVRFTLYALDSLPGYLFAGSTMIPSTIVDPSGSDDEARMFLKVPMTNGRDLNDVVIEPREGEEWVRYGSALYRPQASVPEPPAGDSRVMIGAEGFAEWRKIPRSGSFTITGASAWKLYDADFTQPPISGTDQDHQVVSPANAYLMLFGAPNATITITTAGG